MIISIDAEKVIDKIQYPFMVKTKTKTTLQKSRHRRNITQHDKSHIRQTYSKHYPQWGKINSISSKIKNKSRMPTLTITIQHSFGSFSHSNQRRKRNKRNTDWKEEVQFSIFADDMILYIENAKDTTRKLLELIN